jgi:hypothetical protein
MTLSSLDRLSLVYDVLSKNFGPKSHRFTGPICWYQDPRSSLAQVITVCRDPIDLEVVSLVSQILRIQESKEMVTKPRVWARKEILSLGLLEPDVLAFGVGEGMGMARSIGYDLTDIDALRVHDAIYPIHKEDGTPAEIRDAWLAALPGMAGYASWHLLSFFYSPYMGASRTIEMIDTETLTKESFDRLYQVDPNCVGLTVQKTLDILVDKRS